MVAYQSFKHKAWVLLMVINTIVVIILNYLLLPITDAYEACESTGQRAISAFVVCYSRFDIEVNSFIEAFTEWSLM